MERGQSQLLFLIIASLASIAVWNLYFKKKVTILKKNFCCWSFYIIGSLVEMFRSDSIFFMISKVSRTDCEKGWFPFGKNCYSFSSSVATCKDAMVRKYLKTMICYSILCFLSKLMILDAFSISLHKMECNVNF